MLVAQLHVEQAPRQRHVIHKRQVGADESPHLLRQRPAPRSGGERGGDANHRDDLRDGGGAQVTGCGRALHAKRARRKRARVGLQLRQLGQQPLLVRGRLEKHVAAGVGECARRATRAAAQRRRHAADAPVAMVPPTARGRPARMRRRLVRPGPRVAAGPPAPARRRRDCRATAMRGRRHGCACVLRRGSRHQLEGCALVPLVPQVATILNGERRLLVGQRALHHKHDVRLAQFSPRRRAAKRRRRGRRRISQQAQLRIQAVRRPRCLGQLVQLYERRALAPRGGRDRRRARQRARSLAHVLPVRSRGDARVREEARHVHGRRRLGRQPRHAAAGENQIKQICKPSLTSVPDHRRGAVSHHEPRTPVCEHSIEQRFLCVCVGGVEGGVTDVARVKPPPSSSQKRRERVGTNERNLKEQACCAP